MSMVIEYNEEIREQHRLEIEKLSNEIANLKDENTFLREENAHEKYLKTITVRESLKNLNAVNKRDELLRTGKRMIDELNSERWGKEADMTEEFHWCEEVEELLKEENQ